MGVALSIATFLVVIFTMGFDIDPKTGEVIRKGLIILDAHPETTNITINGEPRGQTKARITMPEGQYDISLQRDGYRTWNRSIVLEGSSIAQLVYAFLFPVDLLSTTEASYTAKPLLTSQSPDRRWYLVSRPGELASFDVYDLNSADTASSTITLPTDILTFSGENHVLSAAEWSTDNRHVLIKHTWSQGSEYIVIDRDQPLLSLNITKIFPNLPVSQMTLRDKSPDEFYAYIGSTKSLVRLNVRSRQVTALLRDVTSFKPYKDKTVLYTKTIPDNKDKVSVHILDDGTEYKLQELPVAKSYMLDLAEYDRTLYVVAGSPVDGKVYIYESPLLQISNSISKRAVPYRVMAVKKGYSTAFSQNARFISLHGPNEVVVHDAEEQKQYRYIHDVHLSPGQELKWMDGHRLYAVDEKKTVVMDFDGSNQQELLPTDPGFLPVFNRDYDVMFQIKSVEKQFNFQRVNLVVSRR